ncbi:hypothetical protein LCI18_009677 [Fusarium solani-melongenae]|uniref:Uncharacterized protein n=1 Tax=Fusarium solani subsp. cucurbitae TaxID=2747967 RepID=A0ACD3ZC79_FUSSC|nr:hypothetical protein LCI18_009677 [Fusarium solani-melongenae]
MPASFTRIDDLQSQFSAFHPSLRGITRSTRPDIVKDPQRLLNACQCLGSEVLDLTLSRGPANLLRRIGHRPSCCATLEPDKQPAYSSYSCRCSSDDVIAWP